MSNSSLTDISRRNILGIGAASVALPLAPYAATAAESARELPITIGRDQAFDCDWRFFRGDSERYAMPTFDDRKWRTLDLPHDWSIEDLAPGSAPVNAVIRDADTAPLWQTVKMGSREIGPFSGSLSSGGVKTAFTVGGVGWYRKRFRLPSIVSGQRVEIVFDGVYMNAEVWVNGHRLGERPYGYSPFAYDLTPHLNFTGENVIAVRVANLGSNSRWYSGSGIYRHVWLNVAGALRFELWGVSVTPQSVAVDSAAIQVHTTVLGASKGTEMLLKIRDAGGRVVAQKRGAPPADGLTIFEIETPKLWSPKEPVLYQAECELFEGGNRSDRLVTRFGIRSVEVDAQKGLLINGESYKLRGGCLHHDNGLLGAAAHDRAEERKLELLKERGFNAVRTAHNPPSPAFLDACDKLGMMVVEEAFDCWSIGKSPDDYQLYFDGWWRDDLTAMVKRDGNHPSVIMWSIGNEIPDVTKPSGVESARALTAALRVLDSSRPIAAGINGSTGPEVTRPDGKRDSVGTQFLDVAGYNYSLGSYERDHVRFPDRVMMGTESFPREVDSIWRLTERSPYLIGDFVWAAMDYLGEVGVAQPVLSPDRYGYGLADYPWINAFVGDLDLIGQQKPPSLLRDVVWGVSVLEMSVQRPLPEGRLERGSPWGWKDELQSWTWPGAEGTPLGVQIFTRGDRVELELNGKPVGEKTLTDADKSLANFSIPYAPGRLVATAFSKGKKIGRKQFKTAGAAAAIKLRIDRPRISSSRNDLAFITLEVTDGAGGLVPDAVAAIEVALSGPAELIAFGNANPRGVGSFQQPVAKTWHGRALAILRPLGQAGTVSFEARSKELKAAKGIIRVA